MSQMVELLESFPLTDVGSIESWLEGVRFFHSGTFPQVARALKIMQRNYAEKLDVEKLANTARISVSAFHRAFKDITSDSPMQYLKKVRLTRAKDLMVRESMKAYIAANKVGYESSTQFSREFKRYFGQSPADMTRYLRV